MGPNKLAYEYSFADKHSAIHSVYPADIAMTAPVQVAVEAGTGAVEVPALPTLDAGGGVRWDPMSNTAEVRVLSTAPVGNAMREMVAVRSAPGSRP